MAKPKIYKDPIHGQLRYEAVNLGSSCPNERGDKQLSWLLRKLIDTSCFQRLRHIRQNGLANLVFHGAEHSRFGHSMGVAFLAREMYDKIVRNGDQKVDQKTRLATCAAALLHDIGHGPFSHTLEDTLGKIGHTFNHEALTVRYITERDSPIFQLLAEIDNEFPQIVKKFIDKERESEHWSYKIVSSQLDADRLDYLLRDASLAGFRGHGFDLNRLLDMLQPHNSCIAVDRRALEAVEAYLVMLDQMYRAVYFHHAIRAANVLLESIFKRAFDLHRDGGQEVFPSLGSSCVHPLKNLLETEKDTEIELNDFGRIGEFHLWQCIEYWTLCPRDGVLNDLAARLLDRRLFKTIELNPHDINKNNTLQEKAKDLVRKQVTVADKETVKYYVAVDEPKRVSYKLYDWTAEAPDESIWLIGGSNEPKPIEQDERSKIVAGLKDQRYFARLIFPEEIREELEREAADVS